MPPIYAFRPQDQTTYPANIALRAPETLASWLRFFPEAQPKARDEEDWIENACILEAAEKAGIAVTILPPDKGGMFISGASWNLQPSKPDAPLGVMLGTWNNSDHINGLPIDINVIGSDQRSVRAAANYARSATFLRHAGRPIVITSADVDGDDGIEAGLRKIVDETGSGNVFVKTVYKAWSTTFNLNPGSESLWNELRHEDESRSVERSVGIAWYPIQHEGAKNQLIIQGCIAPRFEYRIVIIDGKPVTAAGCVEAFTPAENTAVFDPQMEEVRSDGNIVARPDLVARYLEFAETFTREFAEEHGDGLDYSLDVCIDANTGNVVPIELNPPLNLGAYARSTDAWLGAIIERAERLTT